MNHEKRFGWLDYLLFILAVVFSVSIGIYQMVKRRKKKGDVTASELLMASQKMNIVPVSLSMTASLVSGILILGVPSEVVQFGGIYYLTSISYVLNYIFCAHCVVPVFHRLQLCSGYQYLELRFHAYVRRTASMTFLLQTLLYMAIVIYAPAITINQTTGLSPFIAIALCGSLCTLYTAIGGLRAVIWTDVFQALVIIISLITTAILGIQDGGGIQKVFKVIMEGDRLPYFNFDPDPRVTYTAWSTILGSTFIGIASFSFQQMIIQRIVSLPTKKAATAAVYCALPISLLILTLLCITGLVIYAKIADCNPIRSIYTYNNILPYFVTQMLNDYPGMRGLFVACIFCGALSTISSGLNSLSAVAFYDFIVPIYKKSRKTSISGSMSGHITMTLTFIFGFVAMGFSFGLNYLGSNILHIALIVLNVISGPIAGMFILGFFIPNANTKGALIGFTLAAIMTIWLGIGNVMTNIKLATRHANTTTNATNDTQCVPMLPVDRNLYKNRSGWDGFHSISYLWFGFIPIAIVFIFGSLISLITGGSSKNKRKYTIWKYKTIPLSPRNI